MFIPSDYADISRVIIDSQYAKEKGLIVKSQKLKNIEKIEDKLKAIPSDDPDWRNKVTALKRDLADAKKSNSKRLHIIKYNKSSLNSKNINSLGMFRSIITDGTKIISFSPVKSLTNEDFIQNTNESDDIKYSEFVEGTMINMFINPLTDDWEISTRSNIGGRCKFYQDFDKTFREMFLEAFMFKNYEFSMFKKEYSYSWVLQHPSNRIVQPITKPNIVLTSVFSFESKTNSDGSNMYTVKNVLTDDNYSDFINESYSDIFIDVPLKHSVLSIQEYQDYYGSEEVDYQTMGTVIYNQTTGARTKIRNSKYEYVKSLKGNSPKLQYRYYALRQLGAVGDYLKYYPEDTHKFSKFREQMHEFTDTLWRNYIRCYVHKEKPLKEFPFEYRSHMFKLHEYYINDLKNNGERVDKLFVINYINTLPPGHTMHSINYPLRKSEKKITENIIKNTNCVKVATESQGVPV